MMLHIKCTSTIINIIQIYAPIADKDKQKLEKFYSNLDEVLKITKNIKLWTNMLKTMGRATGKTGATDWYNFARTKTSGGARHTFYVVVRGLLVA